MQGFAQRSADFIPLLACSQASLAAEILFLRKQLAFYQERKIKPRRFDDATRLSMVLFSKFFDWRSALINVTPDTFTGWHKKAFQLFWRWKSRSGRPRLPRNIQRLIVEMAINNPTWGQERVADELSLKLGILVSPRTVKKYWPEGVSSGPRRVSSQRWKTFVRYHIQLCSSGNRNNNPLGNGQVGNGLLRCLPDILAHPLLRRSVKE